MTRAVTTEQPAICKLITLWTPRSAEDVDLGAMTSTKAKLCLVTVEGGVDAYLSIEGPQHSGQCCKDAMGDERSPSLFSCLLLLSHDPCRQRRSVFPGSSSGKRRKVAGNEGLAIRRKSPWKFPAGRWTRLRVEEERMIIGEGEQHCRWASRVISEKQRGPRCRRRVTGDSLAELWPSSIFGWVSEGFSWCVLWACFLQQIACDQSQWLRSRQGVLHHCTRQSTE
ncbi:hypothetical protein JOL62DRAFT_567045 [Phyllosticta paracitricarpa]|uniref:Uncharacterized protein n=1 Tax=Phyllosticta paracitricarpa TaxID=2016321 RepID=A0ABR1NEP1_9PEZI